MKNIYWYAPDKVFTSFRDRLDNPSFRLRCWHLHEKLLREGYRSQVVSDIEDIKDPYIVTLMSFGEEEYELAKWVRGLGGHVLHDFCENIRGIPILEETKRLCSLIVCCSSQLVREQRESYGDKAVLVKDPYEDFPIKHNIDHNPKRLRVGWSGMSGNAPWAELLKPVVEEQGMEYIEISNRPESTHQWDINSWFYHLASCDVCVCPQAHWEAMGKSNVKVTTAMALGIPVLASPIPSYEEILTSGSNGFICHEIGDWGANLAKLRDIEIRKEMVSHYGEALEPYSSDRVYQDWLWFVKLRCSL